VTAAVRRLFRLQSRAKVELVFLLLNTCGGGGVIKVKNGDFFFVLFLDAT